MRSAEVAASAARRCSSAIDALVLVSEKLLACTLGAPVRLSTLCLPHHLTSPPKFKSCTTNCVPELTPRYPHFFLKCEFLFDLIRLTHIRISGEPVVEGNRHLLRAV